jgi:hypothetical protein
MSEDHVVVVKFERSTQRNILNRTKESSDCNCYCAALVKECFGPASPSQEVTEDAGKKNCCWFKGVRRTRKEWLSD